MTDKKQQIAEVQYYYKAFKRLEAEAIQLRFEIDSLKEIVKGKTCFADPSAEERGARSMADLVAIKSLENHGNGYFCAKDLIESWKGRHCK